LRRGGVRLYDYDGGRLSVSGLLLSPFPSLPLLSDSLRLFMLDGMQHDGRRGGSG